MNFNKVILAGRLIRDPELIYTPKGTAVAKIGLAVNRQWKTESGEKKEEATFIDVDCFGRQAETIGQYLKKGREIFIEGRLKMDSWEKDGKKHQRLGVVMESFQFVGGKEEGGQAAPKSQPASAPKEPEEQEPPF